MPDDLPRSNRKLTVERYAVSLSYVYAIAEGRVQASAGGPLTTGWREQDRPGVTRTTPRTNTGYWDVTVNGAGNRIDAWVRYGRRQHWVGRCQELITAAKAYDAKARELGMPREKLNFPEDAE